MFSSLMSFFNIKSLDDTMKLGKKPGVESAVLIDELSKKPISSCRQKLNSKQGGDGKGAVVVMRVKVKMTKQEAARMLSRCKKGGVLKFKDVANELNKIPIDRVTLDQCPPPCTSSAAGPVLKSIPEDYY